MFLYQKLKYNYKHIDVRNHDEAKADLDLFIERIIIEKPKFICFDTETDGLNIITAKPFLMSIGFNKTVVTFDFDKDFVSDLWRRLEELNLEQNKEYLGLFAHNCKFDFHICDNGGARLPDSIKILDSITVARLTEYTDERESMSLEYLGQKYVDDNSKFAGKVIKSIIAKLNKDNMDSLKKELMDNFPDDGLFTITKKGEKKATSKLTNTIKSFNKSNIVGITNANKLFKFIEDNRVIANYRDVYIAEPDLMKSYSADDIVIMIEYLNKSIPTLYKVDENLLVTNREGKLIRAVADMENTGLKVDVDYVLKCRDNLLKYRELLYMELLMYTGKEFSVGEHGFIRRLLEIDYHVKTDKADEKALIYIRDRSNGELVDIINDILELRTIDKWLSTYIDGKLKTMINGRIYTEINNSGTVSGRVSCNMQQQPKDPLLDRDGNELFHPRKMFICDDDCMLVLIDESQMELRVQAYYTILASKEPDINLCRAYMPYKCYVKNDDCEIDYDFDFNNIDHIKNFNNRVWHKYENDEEWTPTDLHSETARNAFPEFALLDPVKDKALYKKLRGQAKTCNFLEVYTGGIKALQETLDCDYETAVKLHNGFHKAFSRIADYQEWVCNQAAMYGYVENLYGRRYYMNNSRFFYKLCNYLIQGSCADMVKTFEIKIYEYLKENNLKTKLVLPIHDEIVFSVPKGEEYIVKDLKHIMEDVTGVIKNVPMVAEVDYSTTNWKEKKGWDLEL